MTESVCNFNIISRKRCRNGLEQTFVCGVFPPDTQLSAVDSLIDSMMLVEQDDDDEEQKDMFKVHHIANPAFQRHFQVLHFAFKRYSTSITDLFCVEAD